jgi:hypothetical protein
MNIVKKVREKKKKKERKKNKNKKRASYKVQTKR